MNDQDRTMLRVVWGLICALALVFVATAIVTGCSSAGEDAFRARQVQREKAVVAVVEDFGAGRASIEDVARTAIKAWGDERTDMRSREEQKGSGWTLLGELAAGAIGILGGGGAAKVLVSRLDAERTASREAELARMDARHAALDTAVAQMEEKLAAKA